MKGIALLGSLALLAGCPNEWRIDNWIDDEIGEDVLDCGEYEAASWSGEIDGQGLDLCSEEEISDARQCFAEALAACRPARLREDGRNPDIDPDWVLTDWVVEPIGTGCRVVVFQQTSSPLLDPQSELNSWQCAGEHDLLDGCPWFSLDFRTCSAGPLDNDGEGDEGAL